MWYREDFATIEGLPPSPTEHVPFDKILEAAAPGGVAQDARPRAVASLGAAGHVLRHRRRTAYEVDLQRGAHEVSKPEAECQVSLDSQAAWYTFAHRWGLPTLGVSGRYRLNRDERAFLRLKKLGSAYAAGLHTRGTDRGLWRSVWNDRHASYLWARRHGFGSQFVAHVLHV